MQQAQKEAKKPTIDDKEWWDQLYQAGKTPWELGKPSPPLVTFLKSPYAVPPGKVAVLGCGTGNDCLPFVQAGFEVTGVDFAPTAIHATLQKFQKAGVAGTKGYLLNRDVFEIHEYDGYYDYIVEHCFLPALEPSRRRRYVMTVSDLLKPGGKLIAVWWLVESRSGPPFTVTRDDIYSLFDAHFSIDIAYSPKDSVPQRRNSELFALMTKR